jgi:(E)-4-hydroxy-3-methylbut-2-enyl-diphosphate synthase
MVQAYRLLIDKMMEEFGECYPLHLGVTEAGDGEDGRIKSAIGIGTLLEDGIGDTIRVSLTEDPEFEIPVCKDIVRRYATESKSIAPLSDEILKHYHPFEYKRRQTFAVHNIGGTHVPVVVADLSAVKNITPAHLKSIGYTYDEATDKWAISDAAADYVFTGHQVLDFALPGTLSVIVYASAILKATHSATQYYPIFEAADFMASEAKHAVLNFVMIDAADEKLEQYLSACGALKNVVLCFSSTAQNAMQFLRAQFLLAEHLEVKNPAIIITDSTKQTPDEHLIHYATEMGALLIDGYGDGVCLGLSNATSFSNEQTTGRTYLPVNDLSQFLNNTAFGILQASRTRISKTEYISCPSCGRTLFDLQETTSKIRSVTNHLKGLKIAIMGCIVNGPGEMADADFGYVGSGVGKITLYKGKEVVKKNIDSNIAVAELINLLKENDAWIEPA